MKNPKVYEPHKCLNCTDITTLKSYCKKCFTMIVKTPFVPSGMVYITADMQPKSKQSLITRHENIDKLEVK